MSWRERHLGRLLIVLRLDSIRSKIVALAVLATLAPALSTAALSYVRTRQALTETLEGELLGIGSQAARELDLWVKQRRYDVRIFVGSLEVSENLDRIPLGGPRAAESLARLTDYLSGVQGRFPYYTELLVVDTELRSVASSRPQLREAVVPNDWLPRLRVSQGILGEPYWDDSLESVAVSIAQPIESPDARFLGALVATLMFDSVQATLESLVPGEGGRVELIMADGRRIAGSGSGPGLEPALPDGVLAELVASSGGTREYALAGGESALGTITEVPLMDWSVVAEIPTDEAYAQVTQLRNSTAVLLSALLLIVGYIAYLLGLYIVRPLDRLATGASAVARGDLSVDLPVTGGGEVGYLTRVFNRMVGQLRRSREELSDANAALREHNVELEHLSMTDALTGLYNRRYVMNELDKEVHRAARHGRKLGVLMLDIDQFKQYNDKHGHLAGDQVLTGMGRVIEDATREHDVPGRFGGEEFIVLMPDSDLRGTLDAAERVRVRLREEVFEGGAVTCSIGASAYPIHGGDPHALIAAADVALYEAKASGRDRVIAAVAAGAVPTAAPKKNAAPERNVAPKKNAAPQRNVAPKRNAAPQKKAAAEASGAPKNEAAPRMDPAVEKKATAKRKSASAEVGAAGDATRKKKA